MCQAIQAEAGISVPTLQVLAFNQSGEQAMIVLQSKITDDFEDMAEFHDEGLAIRVAESMAESGHDVRVINQDKSIIWPKNKDIENQ